MNMEKEMMYEAPAVEVLKWKLNWDSPEAMVQVLVA